jgi:hypothetical protein
MWEAKISWLREIPTRKPNGTLIQYGKPVIFTGTYDECLIFLMKDKTKNVQSITIKPVKEANV